MLEDDMWFDNAICTKFEVFNFDPSDNHPHSNIKKTTIGGLYDGNGHLILNSIRKGGVGGDHVVSNAPLFIGNSHEEYEIIKGKSIFLGNLMNHYGHFVTEGLSRFGNYNEFCNYDNFIFMPFIFPSSMERMNKFHDFFFDRFGIDRSKIKIIREKTLIESVYVPKQNWIINTPPDINVKKIYKHISLSVNPKQGKYFLSRKKDPSNRIGNIEDLEYFFLKNGYEIVYPEFMEVEDQVSIYSGADTLVSLSGSGAHNIIFSKKGCSFIEIGDVRTPKKPISMQKYANSLSDATYHFVPFVGQDGILDIKSLNSKTNLF